MLHLESSLYSLSCSKNWLIFCSLVSEARISIGVGAVGAEKNAKYK